MKSERQRMPCYVCKAAPIRRICLADQIVSQGKYLFCDGCRKQDALRKHASQIYEIDSYSAPLSLLSINSTQKQLATQVFQKVKGCRKSMQTRSIPTFDLLMSIEDKILKKTQQLYSTFDSQTSQIFEEQLKDHLPSSRQQIFKKVMTLKWVKENKDVISNASVLSEKIAIFSKGFTQGIESLFSKIEILLNDFFVEFNVDNLFTEKKRQEKPESLQKQNLAVKNIKKVIKQNIKPPIKKPLPEEKTKIQKQTQPIREKHERQQKRMQLQNQEPYMNIFNNPKAKQTNISVKDLSFERLIFPPYVVKQGRNEQSQKEKQQKQKQPSENKISEPKPIKKKPSSKPLQKSQKSISQQEPANKPLPLVLQPVPTKSDYLDEQKLIINLKNIAQVFWMLNEEEKNQATPSPIRDPKIKYEHGLQKIVEQKRQPLNAIDTKKTIRIQSIKYLQVQELPKRMVQLFTVTVGGRQIKVKYSLQKLYEKINSMENLEQIHIFSSILFSNQTDILTMIFTCPNIKVLTFSCFNSVTKMLPKFKQMVGDQINEEIKVLEIAGNIPYWENIEIADVKLYFPQSEKNKKISDEKFSKNYEWYIENEKRWLEGSFNQKERFENRNTCWFIPHDRTEVEGERSYRILQPHENKLLAQCFKELRSCWIPYLTTERLTQKQQISNIQKIQHLTLGFHYFVLQPIPQKFYYADKNFPISLPFCKSLINLKSINLINLNINDFFMRSRFCPNWKDVLSLRIENCIGLTNEFYKNLPKYCPKLRKICVNNLEAGIEGDFLTKLQHLETIILPWSQLSYKRSGKIDEIEKGQKPLEKEQQANGLSNSNGNGVLKLFRLKKWKYVNLYGCSWFHTDFFALIQPQSLQHLNIGKCDIKKLQDLIYYLRRFTNLQSLCLDELQLTNKELFNILRPLTNLARLSIAHCPNIDLSFGKLDSEELQILDRMTHLDVRSRGSSIAYQYTMKMVNPKYLIMSRGFELEENEPETLAKRQITACSASF